ncbi:MAG: hypothetical protein ACLR43_10375 [Faecalibacillus faecis]
MKLMITYIMIMDIMDDYRKYPMIGLIQPDTYKDMGKSIADIRL